MPSLSALLLATIAFAIGALQLVSARWITEEESTHPAYKLEKVVWGAVYLGNGVVALLAEAARTQFRFFSGALLIGSTAVAFVFIRHRRHSPLYRVIRLRTQRGPVASRSLRENNCAASETAALLRHHRAGGGAPLLSDWAVAEIEEALGVPPRDAWVARERQRLRRWREAKAAGGEDAPTGRGDE